MKQESDRFIRATLLFLLLFAGATNNAYAQGTTFTYQGRLQDAGTNANGSYDFQFTLWDASSAGTQEPQPTPVTVTRTSVAVTNGAFTVQLDFGASAFPGPSRFLETSVRLTGSGSFTLLSPRQPITSTPYAIRTLSGATADALSSACVSCVQNSQINSVAGSKVSGAIAVASVPGGSGNYIQNATTQQASSNFNISGNGNAGGTLSGNIVNAAKQYNLGGNKVLSVSGNGLVPNSNTFVGVLAGSSNTPAANGDFEGGFNSFLGNFAGASNTTGYVNSFFGYFAGALSTTGRSNSFFGMNSGRSNTIGSENSFFGLQSGNTNSNGGDNSFFGFSAGLASNSDNNSFFGANAGLNNDTGAANSFFGYGTGLQNVTGFYNTAIGSGADFGAAGLSNATAIGANTVVAQSNSLVLGNNANVGIGTSLPVARFHVAGNSLFATNGTNGVRITPANDANIGVLNVTNAANTVNWLTVGSNGQVIMNGSGNVGIGTTGPDAKLTVNGTADKPGGGSWGTFSDERMKNIKGRFNPGLNAVMRLQPLRYEYKRDNALGIKSEGEHVGFSAQAVQKIIPEAVTTNANGYLLVNNDPILWTMLNAIKEQQAQIQQQQEQFKQQRAALAIGQQQVNALKKLVCRSHRRASVCR